VAAATTLLATLAALFGWRFMDWYRRPKLALSFMSREPYCRFTILTNNARAYWIRIRVQNAGRSAANGCIAKVAEVIGKDGTRRDIDPLQVRWCGVPRPRGFEVITLAKKQFEFFNVVKVVEGSELLQFETFPDSDPGHETTLRPRISHLVRVVVAAGNADPAELVLDLNYNGKFDTLPDGLNAATV
jgi:hypothetical protein